MDRAGESWGLWSILTYFGQFCVAAGEWEEAERQLTHALALAARLDELQWRYWVWCALAELDLLRGHPDRALSWLEPIRRDRTVDPTAALE